MLCPCRDPILADTEDCPTPLCPNCYESIISVYITNHADLTNRLRKRAEIRRQIPNRKSVQEGKPDRIADLLEEAADALEGK